MPKAETSYTAAVLYAEKNEKQFDEDADEGRPENALAAAQETSPEDKIFRWVHDIRMVDCTWKRVVCTRICSRGPVIAFLTDDGVVVLGKSDVEYIHMSLDGDADDLWWMRELNLPEPDAGSWPPPLLKPGYFCLEKGHQELSRQRGVRRVLEIIQRDIEEERVRAETKGKAKRPKARKKAA